MAGLCSASNNLLLFSARAIARVSVGISSAVTKGRHVFVRVTVILSMDQFSTCFRGSNYLPSWTQLTLPCHNVARIFFGVILHSTRDTEKLVANESAGKTFHCDCICSKLLYFKQSVHFSSQGDNSTSRCVEHFPRIICVLKLPVAFETILPIWVKKVACQNKYSLFILSLKRYT